MFALLLNNIADNGLLRRGAGALAGLVVVLDAVTYIGAIRELTEDCCLLRLNNLSIVVAMSVDGRRKTSVLLVGLELFLRLLLFLGRSHHHLILSALGAILSLCYIAKADRICNQIRIGLHIVLSVHSRTQRPLLHLLPRFYRRNVERQLIQMLARRQLL